MCYPKPGPRCSPHAAAAYSKAHQNVLYAFMNNKKDPELDKLIKIRDKAYKEYEITPAGIRAAEIQYQENPSAWATEKISVLKNIRNQRLAAMKNSTEIKHRINKIDNYDSHTFSQEGDTIVSMSFNHPDLENSINDSRKWSYQLNDEEIATVAWYTGAGYYSVNQYLNSDKNTIANHPDKERLNRAIEVLDNALSKHIPDETGMIVYRRHTFFNQDNSLSKLTEEEIKQKFLPGSIYEPDFYLSTSLNPDNLPDTSTGTTAALQILTKKGVPVTSISSKGPLEFEVIIPRNTKFRVIANDISMMRDQNNEIIKVNVIQLEEI
jgi:hypothetical protein